MDKEKKSELIVDVGWDRLDSDPNLEPGTGTGPDPWENASSGSGI